MIKKKIIKYWTEEDSYYLYKNFNQRPLRELSAVLDRTYESIKTHYYATASKRDWTEYEELLGNGKTCTKCGTRYLLNSLNWHRDKSSSNGFDTYCKECSNKIKREANKERARIAEKKQLEEITKRMLLEESIRIQGLGLAIADVKLKVGQAYKIKTYYRNEAELYQGTLIQDCDKHLVFRGKNGRCESFLKVDLLLEHEYKEVN